MSNGAEALPAGQPVKQNAKLVIAASSLGTVFEWYDFYLYGLLAAYISSGFFSGVNETTAFIFALAAFAAGFAVRPFGALVFGPGVAPPADGEVVAGFGALGRVRAAFR